MYEEPGIDLPVGSQATTYELRGNFKLVAEFEHKAIGAEVRVTPYKTYDKSAFANAHRVMLVHPEQGIKKLAGGMEVGYIKDVEKGAKEMMGKIGGT